MPARPSVATGLLAQPAHSAARAVARARLEKAVEKAAPLLVALAADTATTIGNEEVHDFRVALRRLRSWLRACGDLLRRDISRRERAALRRLARRASGARDAQVQWQWLTAPAEPRRAPAARAAQWLALKQLALYAAEREQLQRGASEHWPQLMATLAGALAADRDPPSETADITLGQHLAPVLTHHLELARRALDRIEHHTQVTEIHRARIKVKRLRYLLEAVEHRSPHRMAALKQLRLLQDALGELHDAHEMSTLLAPLLVQRRGARRVAAQRPALRDLRALRAALRRRELAAFRQSLDLAGSLEVERAWQYIASLSLLLSAPAARGASTPSPAHARLDR